MLEQPKKTVKQPVGGSRMVESLVVFAIGATIMNFVYIDPRGVPYEQIGVPGYDAFYHVKMAALLPEIGVVDEFPWLRFVYWTEHGDRFINHHYGFHVLLAPFVRLSYWLTGDYLPGGRWAMSAFFGLSLMLLNALLLTEGIRWRWFWLLVFLLLPIDFFLRHSYVRALSPSLTFMLLIVLLMFRGRHVWAGIVVAAYVHLYLGGVIYAPLIVGIYTLSCVLGRRGERHLPWRLVMWTSLGWLAGLRSHPYFDGVLEFLQMQVFGTGLDPDISVGGEWNPYNNLWYFAVQMSGPLIVVWAAAAVLRMRLGERLNAKELSLLLMNFAFLFLTFKSQRFIEYWPAFCLLSAALMSAPLMNRAAGWFSPAGKQADSVSGAVIRLLIVLSVCCAIVGCVYYLRQDVFGRFMSHWPAWTVLAAGYLAVPLAEVWLRSSKPERHGRVSSGRLIALMLCGAAFAGIVAFLGWYGSVPLGEGVSPLSFGVAGWAVLAAIYALLARRARLRGPFQASPERPSQNTLEHSQSLGGTAVSAVERQACGTAVSAVETQARHPCHSLEIARRPAVSVCNAVKIVSSGVGVLAAIVLLCSGRLAAVQRNSYCGYDLPAISAAMDFLKEDSGPGDVVFTDDWDVFPVYFYFNSHNRYVVGLDPKFTHSRRPELWERYVKITRGLVPRTFEATWTDGYGQEIRREIQADLTDIRDRFGAKFVVTDQDHKSLASRLARAGEFAGLVYPAQSYEDCRDSPYLVFRIRNGQDGRQ